MNLKFTGKITEIRPYRGGTGQKGEWANVEFEVTESKPQNAEYPQIAIFDFFKNGEYLKYAKEFGSYYPIGSEVEVEFNLKRNKYINKEGKEVSFYKTSAWKVTKINQTETIPLPPFEPAPTFEAYEDDLPY